VGSRKEDQVSILPFAGVDHGPHSKDLKEYALNSEAEQRSGSVRRKLEKIRKPRPLSAKRE